MIYSLDDLLIKMGAPDVKEKGAIEWFYFGADKKDLAGAAHIRLEEGGERLIAELKHIRHNYKDDEGVTHDRHAERFYICAERTARPGHYRVSTMTYDGDTYDKPHKSVIEMGLALFHAKALDISVAMVEQAFNKEDILDPIIDPKATFKRFMQGKAAGITAVRRTPNFKTRVAELPAPTREGFGVVVPFRPRARA